MHLRIYTLECNGQSPEHEVQLPVAGNKARLKIQVSTILEAKKINCCMKGCLVQERHATHACQGGGTLHGLCCVKTRSRAHCTTSQNPLRRGLLWRQAPARSGSLVLYPSRSHTVSRTAVPVFGRLVFMTAGCCDQTAAAVPRWCGLMQLGMWGGT